MTTAQHLTNVAEIWMTGPNPGPTGRFAEVLSGQIEDAGGNVLFAGTAHQCNGFAMRNPYLINKSAVSWVPTEWREVAGDVAGADRLWQLVIAE